MLSIFRHLLFWFCLFCGIFLRYLRMFLNQLLLSQYQSFPIMLLPFLCFHRFYTPNVWCLDIFALPDEEANMWKVATCENTTRRKSATINFASCVFIIQHCVMKTNGKCMLENIVGLTYNYFVWEDILHRRHTVLSSSKEVVLENSSVALLVHIQLENRWAANGKHPCIQHSWPSALLKTVRA